MPREGLSETATHRILNQPRSSPGKKQSSRGNSEKAEAQRKERDWSGSPTDSHEADREGGR